MNIKIEGSNPLAKAAEAKKRGKIASTASPDASSFADELARTSGAGGAVGADSLNPLGALSGMLGVQEVDDTAERAAKGKARAREILDRLDDLRLDLLLGRVPKDKLHAINNTIRAARTPGLDPKITEILDEIELRAAVELAKLGAI